MIILDYSGIVMSAIHAFSADLKKGTQMEKEGLIRHVILSSIKAYKKKYGKKYGDIVIACDARTYWRRDFFGFYKAKRKAARDASDLDWDLIFKIKDEVEDALIKWFPYKVVKVDKAEADDVIAVLVKNTQEFGRYEDVMIISSDGDFIQLQEYDNVEQYSPITRKMVKVNKKELREKVITHIVKGDGGDGVPNIMSKDNVFMIEERQKAVSKKRLEEFIAKGFDACQNDEERRNWHRNETLVNFKYIPEDIQTKIIEQFDNAPKGDLNGVMNYLIKNRCRVLLNEVDEF